jgi:23S rRNA (guanine1835-N2)-methyltransferase
MRARGERAPVPRPGLSVKATTPTRLHSPFGTFGLERYPPHPDQTLLAWCSADTLLLEEARRRQVPGEHILVVNDAYGALCVALSPRVLWTDSKLAALALQRNEQKNSRPATEVVWSTQVPVEPPRLVVMRVPKQRPYFEYQLRQLARVLPEGAVLLAGGMDKHLSPHTAQLLERYLGPTQRFPGQRKARIFSAVRDGREAPEIDSSGHSDSSGTYYCEVLEAELHGLANVFSREKLDIGTRFLLAQLQRLPAAESLMDLACGNGVLGLAAYKQGLAREVLFCDESAMAIASARLNAARLFEVDAQAFHYYHSDGLLDCAAERASLILCNPPFHQEHTVNELAGAHLLRQCGRYLPPGGRLCLVANRHLDYAPVLARDFTRVETIAANSKFKVMLAHKR